MLNWLNTAPLLWIGGLLLAFMSVASIAGYALRKRRERSGIPQESESQQGYVVSAVLGLLALLMGFTFSLAIDRFDTRRVLVLQDANAIGTAYLRAQLLPEPHRSRLTGLLLEFTETKIALAKAQPRDAGELLARDDRLLTDIWAADAAAFDAIKNLDFSSTFINSMNAMIDLDASRRSARRAHVPTLVFAVLLIYLIVTAGVLGYVLAGRGGRQIGAVLLGLLTLSLMLILDIDRPTIGGIREDQGPMERLLVSLRSQPPSVYDRWRMPAQQ
jgi:hypothetical protein